METSELSSNDELREPLADVPSTDAEFLEDFSFVCLWMDDDFLRGFILS